VRPSAGADRAWCRRCHRRDRGRRGIAPLLRLLPSRGGGGSRKAPCAAPSESCKGPLCLPDLPPPEPAEPRAPRRPLDERYTAGSADCDGPRVLAAAGRAAAARGQLVAQHRRDVAERRRGLLRDVRHGYFLLNVSRRTKRAKRPRCPGARSSWPHASHTHAATRFCLPQEGQPPPVRGRGGFTRSNSESRALVSGGMKDNPLSPPERHAAQDASQATRLRRRDQLETTRRTDPRRQRSVPSARGTGSTAARTGVARSRIGWPQARHGTCGLRWKVHGSSPSRNVSPPPRRRARRAEGCPGGRSSRSSPGPAHDPAYRTRSRSVRREAERDAG
jgi:hypothetical protein